MKRIRLKILVLALTVGGFVVGIVKGQEARQKFMFKMRSRYESRKLIAERKSILRNGGVLLDDIEIAAYHK